MIFFNYLLTISLLSGIAWAFHYPINIGLIVLFILGFFIQIIRNVFFMVFFYYTKNIKYEKYKDYVQAMISATLFFLLIRVLCGKIIENILYHDILW